MKAPRQDTKKLILNAAAELLQAHGFSGFSYQHIASRLGIKNAAIHYHYPTKMDLGTALVERYRRNFAWWAAQLDQQRFDGAAKLDAFFELERRYLAEGKVCPLGVVGVEFSGIGEEMREATRALVGELADWLTGVLEEGERDGVFRLHGSASGKAVSILATVQGALQLSRIVGPEVFHQAVAQVRTELGLQEPLAPRRPRTTE